MWDNETTFSDKQTLANAESQNIVDTGGDDFGLGEPVYLEVSLGKGATGELVVAVKTSAAADMAAAVQLAEYRIGATRVAQGGIVLAAALPTGCKRYLKLQYSGASGGTVTAGLVQGAQTAGMR